MLEDVKINDRDMFGLVAGGWTQWTWSLSNPYSSCSLNANLGPSKSTPPTGPVPEATMCNARGLLYPFRTDGYTDDFFTFRGARAYSDANNQWLTPDMYAGDPSNPISSLTYNYGGNNPLMYMDPSGFFQDAQPPCGWTITTDGNQIVNVTYGGPCQSNDPSDPGALELGLGSGPYGLGPTCGTPTHCFPTCSFSTGIGCPSAPTKNEICAKLEAAMNANFAGFTIEEWSAGIGGTMGGTAGAAEGTAGTVLVVSGSTAAGGLVGALIPGPDLTGTSEGAGAAIGFQLGLRASAALPAAGATYGGMAGGAAGDALYQVVSNAIKSACGS